MGNHEHPRSDTLIPQPRVWAAASSESTSQEGAPCNQLSMGATGSGVPSHCKHRPGAWPWTSAAPSDWQSPSERRPEKWNPTFCSPWNRVPGDSWARTALPGVPCCITAKEYLEFGFSSLSSTVISGQWNHLSFWMDFCIALLEEITKPKHCFTLRLSKWSFPLPSKWNILLFQYLPLLSFSSPPPKPKYSAWTPL